MILISNVIYLPNSDIYINLRNRRFRKYEEIYTFIGYDSETFKGCCKLLCNSKGDYLLNANFYEYLDFMIRDIDDKSHRVFWNMDFDLTAIFKLYKQKNDKIKRLLAGYTEQFKEFKLTYLRPKFFVIEKNDKRICFTDLYFMYKLSLNNASKDFLKDEKIDTIDGNELNNSLKYWKDNLDDIIKYCIKDCQLTERLGVFIVNKMKKAINMIPQYIVSHASFSRAFFMKNCKIPSIKWTPENILDIAVNTYFGGRFEIVERGFFKHLISGDINSAYPDTIEKLPSLKYGKWNYINHQKDIFKKENKGKINIGFYLVHLIIPELRISPLIVKYKGVAVFPSGIYKKWITWYEYDLVKDYIYKFYYGYQYEPYKREYYPFQEAINLLYNQKAFYKFDKKERDLILSWMFKIVMNAVYGCFIERHKQIVIKDGIEEEFTIAGKMFNPVYATTITARTRWKLLKDTKKRNWKKIIAFHTDSVIFKKRFLPLSMYFKISTKLGKWSIEKKGKGLILMSGIYQVGKEAKNRGFSTKKQKSLKETEEGKKLDWFEVLRESINKTKNCNDCERNDKCKNRNLKLQFERMKVIKSAESMKRWNNLEKANIFVIENKCMDLNSDKKRNWNRDFIDINDVLTNSISSKTLKMKLIDDSNLF